MSLSGLKAGMEKTLKDVLCASGGQTDKKDVLKLYEAMLRDNNIMESPAYQRFLAFIGLRDRLLRW